MARKGAGTGVALVATRMFPSARLHEVFSPIALAFLAILSACGGKFERDEACASLGACEPSATITGAGAGASGGSGNGNQGVPSEGDRAAGGTGGRASSHGGRAGGGAPGKGGASFGGDEGGFSGHPSAGGEGGAFEAEPACSDGLSDCCPTEYPVWCDHDLGETIGRCFKPNTDCSTVTVCAPEPFARSCPPGDHVVCWDTPCGNDWYGGCALSEYFAGCDWEP
jgi:hypothetical protein